jgi:WD40 repeat protein
MGSQTPAALLKYAGRFAGAASAQAAALAQGALPTRTATKLGSLLLLLGAGLLTYSLAAGPPPEGQRAGPPPALPGPAEVGTQGTDAHGDPLPPGALARLGTVRFRQAKGICAVAFAPGGKAVVSVGCDRSVVLHDVSSGKKLRSFRGETTDPYLMPEAVAFAPDGKTLAAAVGLRQVAVWDVATGGLVGRFDVAQTPVHRLALSHDGRTLAGCGQNVVHVWDVASGKEVGRITAPALCALALAPDGKTLATAQTAREVSSLCVWDAAGGQKRHQWRAHQGYVSSLAFSPDGKRLASANFGIEDNRGPYQLRVWEVSTGEQQFDLPGLFLSLAYSPCGKVLAAAAAGSVSLREAGTGKEIRRIPRGTAWAAGNGFVAFGPQGKVLAVADPWTITPWDVATGKKLGPPLEGHEGVVGKVMFLADGKTLAATDRDGVSFWQLPAARRSGRFEGPRVDAATLSRDGKTLAVSPPDETQAVELWDTASGKKLRALEASQNYSLYALAFSPDGRTLAVARWGGDRTVRVWDVAAGKRVRELALPGPPVQALAFSPDGKTLAVGVGDLARPKTGMVRLLDGGTGRELCKPLGAPENAPNHMATIVKNRRQKDL